MPLFFSRPAVRQLITNPPQYARLTGSVVPFVSADLPVPNFSALLRFFSSSIANFSFISLRHQLPYAHNQAD